MLYRVLLYFLCVVALALTYYLTIEIQYTGFPDGGITDLDRARLPLYKVYLCLNIIFASASAYFGYATPSDKIKRRAIAITVAFLLYAGLIIAIDYYLSLHLDDGAGG
jgi:hypothetical protein